MELKKQKIERQHLTGVLRNVGLTTKFNFCNAITA